MFANTQGGGSSNGVPDVCKIPPAVPTPFLNVGAGGDGILFVPHIYTVSGCAHNQGTFIGISVGDAPGSLGGVSSGCNLGIGNYTSASNKVLTGGMPTTRMTSTTQQNLYNTPGATLSPAQKKVLILA